RRWRESSTIPRRSIAPPCTRRSRRRRALRRPHSQPAIPGTVAELKVAPGAHVEAGDPLLRLHAADEDAEQAASETEYRNALATFLTNPGDDGARNALAAIAGRRQRARDVVSSRTLRAPIAGVIGDIRVRPGQLVAPGAQVMKVVSSATPSVVALMPGFDRPRLELGMTLQIDLPGYHKRREEAVIDAIGSQVIGPDEARRSLGDPIGDALPIAGPVVIVRAHLTTRTFEAGGREYEFADGMLGKAEVKVDHDSLLRVLLGGGGD
ncbi:MAG TPA: HlyD family efflux transporter periplasmic adaptor subunit, partial [Kofleriaceae bacterium]|nr:HlyD family efflux transporter periplasmic adaptor subunit [Kofleriaceae bacterium]